MHENIVICATDLSTPLPYVRTLNTPSLMESRDQVCGSNTSFESWDRSFQLFLRTSEASWALTGSAAMTSSLLSWQSLLFLLFGLETGDPDCDLRFPTCAVHTVCFQTSWGVGVDGVSEKNKLLFEDKRSTYKWLATDVGMLELNDPLSP